MDTENFRVATKQDRQLSQCAVLRERGQSGCYFAVAGHGIARVHNREDRQLVKASYNKASIPHAKNVDGVQADTTDIRTLIEH